MRDTTVLVTGASRGLGRAIADTFAEAGAAVVVSGRESDAVESTVDALGEGATGMRADPRDEYDMERLAETAARHAEGGVDVVVPCDHVFHGTPGEATLDDTAFSAFDDTLRTNARGAFGIVREALPHMPADGRVVVPTAPVARESPGGHGAYAVSMAAVEALARGFAADCEQVVGCVDTGGNTAARADDAPSDDDVAAAIRWAAFDADVPTLDGAVLERDDW